MVFVDLDRFKLVNDSLATTSATSCSAGGRAPDRTCAAATPWGASAATNSASCSRISPGERRGRRGAEDPRRLAGPFHLDGHEAYVTASIGIALFPVDGEEADALMTNADTAMYRAKEQGRNNYQFYRRK